MDEVVGSMAENTSLIVVAHGGSLDACLRSWLGLTHYDDHESPYLYGTSGNGYGRRTFAFDNTSLSLVRVQMHSYRILLLNDICHLRVAQRGREE